MWKVLRVLRLTPTWLFHFGAEQRKQPSLGTPYLCTYCTSVVWTSQNVLHIPTQIDYWQRGVPISPNVKFISLNVKFISHGGSKLGSAIDEKSSQQCGPCRGVCLSQWGTGDGRLSLLIMEDREKCKDSQGWGRDVPTWLISGW